MVKEFIHTSREEIGPLKDLSERQRQDKELAFKREELEFLKSEGVRREHEEERHSREFKVQTGFKTFDIVAGLFTSGLLLWLFLGPGILIGILTIMSQTPWPIWILLIFIGLMIWRK